VGGEVANRVPKLVLETVRCQLVFDGGGRVRRARPRRWLLRGRTWHPPHRSGGAAGGGGGAGRVRSRRGATRPQRAANSVDGQASRQRHLAGRAGVSAKAATGLLSVVVDIQRSKTVANRTGFGGNCSRGHSQRPPISLDTIVARTHMYTHATNVWDSSIVQGPFSVAPCPALTLRCATLASLYARAGPHVATDEELLHQLWQKSPQNHVRAPPPPIHRYPSPILLRIHPQRLVLRH
jgi:hypothetical protein